jgi:hypothetical protein
MSINGVSASTLNGSRTASSDGVDDFGQAKANGPESLPEQETFGVAFVFNSSDTTDSTNLFGVKENPGRFEVQDSTFFDGATGELLFQIEDSNARFISVETTSKFFDSTTHLVVINVDSSQGASGVDIYVDNMTQTGGVSTTKTTDEGFDSAVYSASSSLGFFAQNDNGTITSEKALDLPFIEFNEQPYSQQDRLDLLRRAPGL